MSLTVTNAVHDERSIALRAVDGRIAAVGPDVAPADGDDVLDARGMLLMPPLVNAHTHAAMTLFRGFGDDMPLMAWLEEKIWPAEAKMSPDDVYWGTRLAALEMIRSGTTHFFDMYWHPEAVAQAATDAGIRATVSSVLIAPKPHDDAPLKMAAESLDALAGYGPLVTPSLGPHAIYTVCREALEWVAETGDRHAVPVHIHLSETRDEVDDCLAEHGKRAVPYLEELGLVNERSLLAHGSWLEPFEMETLATQRATIVTNTTSNMKLANGRTFDYPVADSIGVPMALGTDGAASNNNLDMFEEMKIFSITQKFTADDPTVASARDTLELAYGRKSDLVGGTRLEVGEPADFLLIDTGAPEISTGDLEANLVYAATGAVVDTTVVAGRVLMRDRVVSEADEIIAEVRDRAARLTS